MPHTAFFRKIQLRKLLLTIAGLIFGVFLITAVLWIIPFDDKSLPRMLEALSLPWLGATFACTLGLWITGAQKWKLWSHATNDKTSQPPNTYFNRAMAWQLWWGQFLPSSLAIIAGRSWSHSKLPAQDWKKGAKGGFIDQIIEFIFLCSMLPAAAAILLAHQEASTYIPLLALGVAGAIPTIILLARLTQKISPSFLPPLPRDVFAKIILLSAARVFLLVARLVWLAPVFGLAIAPAHLLAATPVLSLILVIPLSPANLGLAEWSWIGLLVLTGTPPETAGLYALGARVIVFIQQSLLLFLYEVSLRWREQPSLKKVASSF